MGRGVLTYTAAYLAGITVCLHIPICPPVAMLAAIILLPAAYLNKKNTTVFLVCSHLAIFACGTGMCSISIQNKHLPPDNLTEYISSTTEKIQERLSYRMKEMIPNPQSHAIICAISIGEKGYMGKEIKKSFSAAGAMHVLALSGLHIGIAFAIIYTLLLPLSTIPYGKKARNLIALLFIIAYSIMSGCSPSVVRAATMIILYKIAAGKFRAISNWDAIAISALISCTISPLQIKDIGFQLSYSAVIGIALMFPTCKNAFRQLVPKWKGWQGYIWNFLNWLWGSLAVSVCCQIATMPASLYHFGYSAPYFLLANLVAIPLATAILYALAIAVPLQWFPYAEDWSVYILNLLIDMLNTAITYIAR